MTRLLKKQHKILTLAREHHWQSASRQLHENLLVRVRELHEAASQIIFRRAPISRLYTLTLRDLCDEIRQLEEEFTSVSLDLKAGMISVDTDEIELQRLYLGSFRIKLSMVSWGAQNRPIEGAPKPAILRHRRLGYRPWLSAVAASQWWDGQSTQDGGSTSNFGTCAAAGPIGTSPANSAFTGRPLDATSGCRAAILRRPDRIQNRPAPSARGARRRRLDGARRRRLDGARRRRLDGARRRRLDGARRRRLGERAAPGYPARPSGRSVRHRPGVRSLFRSWKPG